MTVLLYLLLWLGCLQLSLTYPTNDDGDPLIARYKLQLEKKDVSSPLKDSLLSAILMSEIHGEAQKQRKKAVDSTFIRFGRSSFPVSHRHSSQASPSNSYDQYRDGGNQQSNGERSEMDIVRNDLGSSREMEEIVVPEAAAQTYDSPLGSFRESSSLSGCRLANSGDLVRALMGNTCNRGPQKVKRRENVNDTFIRFGKRESPRRLTRAVDEDTQLYR